MTIALGPLQDPTGHYDFTETYKLGSVVCLPVRALGHDARAMAVKVKAPSPISDRISFPHVTVAINQNEGGKPFHSNQIPAENFEEQETVLLTGIVTEITP
jgi:hypothetical protein